MTKSTKDEKKTYIKPEITRHQLKIKEVAMLGCKDGVGGSPSGPSGTKCLTAKTPCATINLTSGS